jgi:hypothetical protein
LLFSGNHVAIAVDPERVIHVSQAIGKVAVEALAAAAEPGSDAPLLRRRLSALLP